MWSLEVFLGAKDSCEQFAPYPATACKNFAHVEGHTVSEPGPSTESAIFAPPGFIRISSQLGDFGLDSPLASFNISLLV